MINIKKNFFKHWFLIENRLRHTFPLGEFGRNTITLAGGMGFGQGIGLITMPLLSRLYTPDDFGTLALYTSILSILLVFSSLRYEWAIPIAKDDEAAASLLILSLLILTAFGIIIAVIIWLVRVHIINWGEISRIKPYLWLLLVGCLGVGSYQVLNAWAIRQKNFSTLAKTKIRQSIIGSIIQLGLGLFKVGPLGLLLGNMISQVTGVEILIVQAMKKERKYLHRIHFKNLQQVAYQYNQFPIFSTISSLINTAGIQIIPILLTAFYNPMIVGWFALSQKVIGIPLSLIGSAVSQTFWAEAARLIKSDPIALQSLFFKLTKKLLVTSFLIAIVGIISPLVFEFIFGGPHWKMAGLYSLYLTPMSIMQFVVSTVSHLSVHELQQWQFKWDMGRFALTFLCFWIGGLEEWSPATIIGMYSILMTMMYGVLYLLNVYALRLKANC